MCHDKRKPHVHAVLICEWAKGAIIESKLGGNWQVVSSPTWDEHREYRIKPEQSDLEKYGVEVGDVWFMDDKLKLFVGDITNKLASVQELESRFHLTYAVNISPRFETLLFRRGEVNKL